MEKDIEWYNSLLPWNQWIADVYGLNNTEAFNAMEMTYVSVLSNLYNYIYPKMVDIPLKTAYDNISSTREFDNDLWNSINNKGYGNLTFSQMTPEQWKEIYDDYMVGYNDFTSKNPYLPYSERMLDRNRRIWDTTYEGYVGRPNENPVQAEAVEPSIVNNSAVPEVRTRRRVRPTLSSANERGVSFAPDAIASIAGGLPVIDKIPSMNVSYDMDVATPPINSGSIMAHDYDEDTYYGPSTTLGDVEIVGKTKTPKLNYANAGILKDIGGLKIDKNNQYEKAIAKHDFRKELSTLAAGASGLIGRAISDGYSTGGVGEGIQAIGSGIGQLAGTVNPGLGLGITVGSNILGGAANRFFGIKKNTKNINAVKQNALDARRTGNALAGVRDSSSFFDLAGRMTNSSGFSAGDLYKGGIFRKRAARNKGNMLLNDEKNALAFQTHGMIMGAEGVDRATDDNAMSTFAAYGGPLSIANPYSGLYNQNFGGALGIMQRDKYLDTIDRRTDAIVGKNSTDYVRNTLDNADAFSFDDGGLLKGAFLDDFATDPVGAVVRYNRGMEQLAAERETQEAAAAREAEYEALRNQVSRLETQNMGLQAMLSATPQAEPAILSTPPSLPILSSQPSQAPFGGYIYDVLPQMLKNAGLDIRVTSGYRKAGAVGKSGNRSWHPRHGAVDIVPQGKTTFEDIENVVLTNPEIRDYMLTNGFGYLDETDRTSEGKALMAKTGATGNHLHFGRDTNARKYYQSRMHAFGGELGTNGTDFTNGLLEINAGGTHGNNPLGGVPMGVDNEGVPNLVEEGETIFNDYVFSRRMKVPKELYNELGLGGALKKHHNKRKEISFADASKKLAEESEQRPNDPISIAGLEASLSRLAEVQEAERMKNEMREYAGLNGYAYGGKKGNMFEGTGSDDNELERRRRGVVAEVIGDSERRVVEPRRGVSGEVLGDQSDLMLGYAAPDYLAMFNPFNMVSLAEREWQVRKRMADLGEDRETAEANYDYEQSRYTTGAPLFAPGRAGGFRSMPVRQNTGAYQMSRQAARSQARPPKGRGKQGILYENMTPVESAKQAVTGSPNGLPQGWSLTNDARATMSTEKIVEGPNVGGGRFTGRKNVTQKMNPKLASKGKASRGNVGNEYEEAFNQLEGTVGMRSPYLGRITLGAGAAGAGIGLVLLDDQQRAENLDAFLNGQPQARGENNAGSNAAATTNSASTAARSTSTPTNTSGSGFNLADYVTGEVNRFADKVTSRAKKTAPASGGTPTRGSSRGTGNGTDNFVPFKYNKPVERAAISKEEKLDTTVKGAGLENTSDWINRQVAEREGNKGKAPYQTWMRYAPAVGSGIMTLADALGLTNVADYTDADKIEAQARRAGNAPTVSFIPVGDYLRYNPFDRLFYGNQLQANARATDRAIMNSSLPSRNAGLLMNGLNTTTALGNLYRQGEESDFAQHKEVADFNNRRDMFNSQMGLEAAMTNARNRQLASQLELSGLAQAAGLRDAIDQRVGAARVANLSNFLTSLGNIGRENFAMNQLYGAAPAHSGYYTTADGRIVRR